MANLNHKGPMNKTGAKKRALSTTVVCPIVYGSVAVHLGKKSEEYSTHRWKLYIRGPNNEDLSTFVEKVAFTLHPSFAEPVREVKKSPFEVSETGWGEFEASIRIYFKDSDERPLDLFHLIKLYPPGPPQLSGSLKKPAPVVSEQYDEVVFFEPTESFLHLLMAYTAKDPKQQLAPLMIEGIPVTGTGVFDDSLDLERLSWIQDHVLSEINAAKDRLVNLQSQVVAITQQRKTEQKQMKAQQSQQQQQSGGEGSMHQQGDGGGDDGNTESGFSAVGGGSKAGAGGTGVTAVGKAAPGGGGGVKAGTKAGAAGSGAAAKRARPSASTAAASAIGSNVAAASGQQPQQLQQQLQQPPQQYIPVGASGTVSKKVLGAAATAAGALVAPSSSTAFAAPVPTSLAPQSYQPTQQPPHHFPQQPIQQQQQLQQQQQQQQQPLLTQSTFVPPPASLQQQYQPQLSSAAAPPLGQQLPRMSSNQPANVSAATTASYNNPNPSPAGATAAGYSNNGNWSLQPSQR